MRKIAKFCDVLFCVGILRPDGINLFKKMDMVHGSAAKFLIIFSDLLVYSTRIMHFRLMRGMSCPPKSGLSVDPPPPPPPPPLTYKPDSLVLA